MRIVALAMVALLPSVACGGRVGPGESSGSSSGSAVAADVDPSAIVPTGATQWTEGLRDVDVAFAITGLAAVPAAGVAFVGSNGPQGGRSIVERRGPSGSRQWQRKIESGSVDRLSVAAQRSGDIAVAGLYSGAVDFGGAKLAGTGVFVAQLEQAGSTAWIWADPATDTGPGILLPCIAPASSGGVLVSCYRAATAMRLDAAGQAAWARARDLGPRPYTVTSTPDGGYLLTFQRLASDSWPLDLGAGVIPPSDDDQSFVAAYAADGAFKWELHLPVADGRVLLDRAGQGIRRAGVDAQGNVWIGGTFAGSTKIGAQDLKSAGRMDIFLAKLDAAGHPVVVRVLGSSNDDALGDLAVDAAGRVVITGYFGGRMEVGDTVLTSYLGNQSLFVAKLEGNGDAIWARSSIDAEGAAVPPAQTGDLLAVDAKTTEIWLAGRRSSTNTLGASRWFLAKLRP